LFDTYIQESVMFRPQPINDAKIIQAIMRRLVSCGIRAPSRVMVACIAGEVTLSGTIKHEHMRQPLIRAARRAEGVRSVIDRLSKIVSTNRV
jgi:osmotically-inducible protein OsmY